MEIPFYEDDVADSFFEFQEAVLEWTFGGEVEEGRKGLEVDLVESIEGLGLEEGDAHDLLVFHANIKMMEEEL